jgi:predicted RNase H-related nuclease YkuK (DUF458 family)
MSLFKSKAREEADSFIEQYHQRNQERNEHMVSITLGTSEVITTASKNIKITPAGLILNVAAGSEYFYPWHKVQGIESIGKREVLSSRLTDF